MGNNNWFHAVVLIIIMIAIGVFVANFLVAGYVVTHPEAIGEYSRRVVDGFQQ